MKKEIEKEEEIAPQELPQEVVVKPKTNRKRLFLILIAGLVVLISLFGYLFFDKIISIFDKYAVVENKETKVELVSDENAVATLRMYKLENDDVYIYIYEDKEFAEMLGEDEKHYSRFIEIGKYNCISPSCEGNTVANNQIVVKDVNYYLYNFEDETIKEILLKKDGSYSEASAYNGELYGLWFKNDDTVTYYSLKNNKEYVFNDKYDSFEKNYIVKTDAYYLFDYTTNSYTKTPVSGEYDIIYSVYYNGTLYGYTLGQKSYSEERSYIYSFYSLAAKKIIANDINGVVIPDAALLNGNVVIDNKLYDLSSGEELHDFNSLFQSETDEELRDCATTTAFGNKEGIYYLAGTNCFSEADGIILNEKYEILFDGKSFSAYSVGVNETGELIINNKVSDETSTGFTLYDSTGQLISNSEAYKEVLGIYGKYIVVVDNDNYLKIINSDGSAVVKITKWTDDMYFHYMLSSNYTYNGKEMIDLTITDNSLYYDEYDEEKETGFGYEYNYNIDTKQIEKTDVEIGGYGKPVLYLYPTKKTNVTVTFENANSLTTTYPKYKNSWQVTAYPNGDLYDKNNNYYYALYWEEIKNHEIDFKEGFYVTKDKAIEFLESKLTTIGLNPKERNEFIMYWLPILEKNGKSLVYFELTEERDFYNKLIINPTPDSLLRVAIHVKKVSKKVDIKEQELKIFKRTGFVAVEWGGVEH